MRITEVAVDANVISEITAFAESIYPWLPKSTPDAARIDVIDETVYAWQQSGEPPLDDVEPDELVFALGVLWGNLLVEAHAWRWADLTFHEFNDWEGRAVVSPNGGLSILPFACIHECVAGKDEVKISASLVALGSNVIPEFPPATYENVMHGLQRIVPRG